MRKLLATLLLALLLPSLAQAQENRAAIQAEINHKFPTNSQGLITAQILRGFLDDFLASIQAITGDTNVIANNVLAQMAGGTVKANIGGGLDNVGDVPLASFFGAAPPNSIPAASVIGASFAGDNPFVPAGIWLTFSATNASSRQALTTPLTYTSVVVYNTGSKPVYVAFGGSSVVATNSDDVVQPGSWVQFGVGTNTYIAMITSGADTTTATVSQGTGLAAGSGGGTTSGTGGLTVTDGAAFTATVSPFTPGGGTYNTSIPALSNGQQGTFALTPQRSLHTLEDNSASILSDLAAIQSGVTSAIPTGTNTIGNVGRLPFPIGSTPITASATGTTAATTATLTGSGGVTTYICGFSIRANATAAVTGTATVTGTITGTLNFLQWTAPLASGIGTTEEQFTSCVPSSGTNISIAVISAAPGSGGNVTVSAWGFRL